MTRAGRDTSIALIVAAALAGLVAGCGGEGPSAGEGAGPVIEPTETETTDTSTTDAPITPEGLQEVAIERTAERYLAAFARRRGNDACELLTKQARAVSSAVGKGECAEGIEFLSEGLSPGVRQLLFQPVFKEVKVEGNTATVSFIGSRHGLKMSMVDGRWLIKSSAVTDPNR